VPELPEVETIRRQFDSFVVGATIDAVDVRWEKSFQGVDLEPRAVVGHAITGIARRGKVLEFGLDRGISLLVHLRMTGQLMVVDASLPRDAWDVDTTRVVFSLDDGRFLVFNDQRKFGRLVVIATDRMSSVPFIAMMGPEPISEGFDGAVLSGRLERHGRLSLKQAILDQRIVAGIGNIYADEALWLAGLSPERRCATLTREELDRLSAAMRSVLQRGIEHGGATMRDYRDARGDRGSYLDEAYVFGRTNERCTRCGDKIVKIRVAGRGTHVCPGCQRP
jgi:formamidopyrimidine-DNA glycosylase